MKKLELTVPPALVFIFAGLIMWIVDLWIPRIHSDQTLRLSVSLFFILVGGALGIAGILQFRRAQTTIHPMAPAETSRLVTSGVYRISRNPMYLGLLFVLIGWGCYLMNPVSLIVAFGFVAYMNRFQIKPEEKVLTLKFGLEYQQYKSSVSRWIG